MGSSDTVILALDFNCSVNVTDSSLKNRQNLFKYDYIKTIQALQEIEWETSPEV